MATVELLGKLDFVIMGGIKASIFSLHPHLEEGAGVPVHKGRNPVMRPHRRDLLSFQRPKTFQSTAASKRGSFKLKKEGELRVQG